MRRLLLPVTCLALLPGCATTWTLLALGGVEVEEGSFSQAKPVGPTERRLVVEPVALPRQDQPPAPEAEAPPEPPGESVLPGPMPPAVEVEPSPVPLESCDCPPEPPPGRWEPEPPAPPRAEPELSVQLSCMLQQRPSRELVHKESFSYDVGWKLMTAFMAVSESAIAGLMAHSYLEGRRRGAEELTPLVLGSYLALDALGSALLFFLPTKHNVVDFEAEGRWTSSPGCPAGLTASVGGRSYQVAPDGVLEADGGARVYEQLATPDHGFELRL
ncbi:MAG TPA: hypothetical protein DFS52_09750, partial [Myxococcales bacterium]|nr:hypothetical protein [Myxococcales bacterium]